MKTRMSTFEFTDDRPITKSEQDLLGRTAFASSLARAISNWKNTESLVIALTGPWGCGKSSIKNLVIETLDNDKKHDIMEFNPWEWNAQEKLTTLFFDEVSRTVGRKDKSKESKQLAKALRRYGNRLKTTATILEKTSIFLPLLFSSVAFTALATFLNKPEWMNFAAATGFISIATALSAPLKKVAAFLTGKSEDLEKDAKENELTLYEIRSEIRTLLEARNKPLLIIMDDIDRLSPEQTQQVFQVIKSNMNFPNVVFLLPFQRDTIEENLKRSGFNGSYLDKIIQVTFNAPTIPKDKLHAVLFEKLNSILTEEHQLQEGFDHNYWNSIFREGIEPFFRSLRDVYRYHSTLSFHCALLRGSDVAEVNAIDLFALECLRVFAPQSYDKLAQCKKELTTPTSPQNKDHVTSTLSSIANLAPAEFKVAVTTTIKLLFPCITGTTSRLSWAHNSRVCHPEMFARYFELSINEADITNSFIQNLSTKITDTLYFCDAIARHDELQQRDILGKLALKVSTFPLDESSSVIKTLLSAGEHIAVGESSFVSLSAITELAELTISFLRRIEDSQQREKIFFSAIEETKALSSLCALINLERSAHRSKNTFLTPSVLDKLSNTFNTIALDIANDDPDAFLKHRRFKTFIVQLNKANDSGSTWIGNAVNSVDRFLLFAEAMIVKRTTFSSGMAREHNSIDKYLVKDLIGFDTCQHWISQVHQLDPYQLSYDPIRLILETIKE